MSNAPLIIDSADKTPPIPPRPPHHMISGADWHARPRARLDWPWHVSAALGIVLLALGGFLVYRIDAALRLWSESSPLAMWLSAFAPAALVGAALVVGVYWLAGKAYYSIARSRAAAYQELLTRTRLGVPVAADTAALMSAQTVQTAEQAAIAMQVQIAPHQRYPLLSTLSEGNHEETNTNIDAVGEEPAPVLPPPNVPILDHLRSQGHIWRSGNSVMVGYDDTATPHYIDIANAPSIGVAGASQYGKSSFVRFALAQLAAQPGPEPTAIVMCDPHGAISEKSLAVSCRALAPSYLLPVATDPDAILASVRQAAQLAQARLDGKDASRYHVVLVIDEFTALMNRGGEYASEMVKLLRRFGNEFGKAHCTTFLIGQSWNSDLAGGTALRNAIQAMVVYGCKRQQAAFLLGTEEGKLAETLAKGTGDALFKPHWASDLVRVKVPWVAASDLEGLQVRAAPSVRLTMSVEASQRHSAARTDGRTVYEQDRIRLYLAALARRGKSREFARQWAESRGLRFENRLWTDALEDARKIDAL